MIKHENKKEYALWQFDVKKKTLHDVKILINVFYLKKSFFLNNVSHAAGLEERSGGSALIKLSVPNMLLKLITSGCTFKSIQVENFESLKPG